LRRRAELAGYVIGHFTKADAEWGRRVAEALGVAEPVGVK